MDDRKWKEIPESELELLLCESLPETPPADVVQRVTPWRQAMNRVLWGLALTCVTLNFWWLNYILPLAGAVLSLLGFRTLRRENGWFGAAWWLRVLRMALLTVSLVEGAFVRNGETLPYLLSALTILAELCTMICLWQGLCTVRGRTGFSATASAAGSLIVWYVALCLLALVNYSGVLIPLAMLAAYAFILRSLWRISREMEEAGYAVRSAPVLLSDEVLGACVVGLCLAGVLCGYLFGAMLPMEWTPVESVISGDAASVRKELLELGFPETVLNDLTQEEILACSGAIRVVNDVREIAIDRGYEESTEEDGVYHYYTVYEEYVRITGVGVELPGERERWRIFHHFEYLDGTKFYGTECAQLWPAWRMNKGWASGGGITGRLLYDDDATYTSPYAALDDETYTTNSIFWGESSQNAVFAEFSMPNRGSRHRGYLTYEILENIDGYLVDAWINLTHQTSRLQYPVLTAKQKRMGYSGTASGAFRTVQDALQFFPEHSDIDGEFTVISE